jgi:maltose alpha-D-glucosyltransferase/alpha-amylase
LLDLFLLQKTAYVVAYESANRAAWLPIPLAGLAALARRLAQVPAEPVHA